MKTVAIVVLVSITAEVIALAFSIFIALRDRLTLELFISSGSNLRRLRQAATSLPAPFRPVAVEFAQALSQGEKSVDETLTRALVRAANLPFSRSVLLPVVGGCLLVFAAFLPLVFSLFEVLRALLVVDSLSDRIPTSSSTYMIIQEQLRGPFQALPSMTKISAAIVSIQLVIFGLHWSLNRAELREARFVRALLEIAASAHKGTRAPVSTQLAEMTSPRNNFGSIALAMVVSLMATTAGWFILVQATPLRKANDHPTFFQVRHAWPDPKPLEKRDDVTLPSVNAGKSIYAVNALVIELRKGRIRFGGIEVTGPDVLPAQWRDSLSTLDLGVQQDSATGTTECFVLADSDLEFASVVEVLRFIGERFGPTRFQLVFERRPGPWSAPKEGLLRPQASFPIELSGHETSSAHSLRLAVSKEAVTLGPESSAIDPRLPGWERSLQLASRRLVLEGAETRMTVHVEPTLKYGQLIEVLGTIDSTCTGAFECGLPGFGMEFRLETSALR